VNTQGWWEKRTLIRILKITPQRKAMFNPRENLKVILLFTGLKQVYCLVSRLCRERMIGLGT
jgi:hypothetical protein